MKHFIRLFNAGFELTTACPCRCTTCGTGAGRARDGELTTGEWLEQVDALGRLGCQRLCLLGGEPLQHPGWADIVKRASALDIDVDMISCGVGLDAALVEKAVECGLRWLTVSVDGTEEVHDRLRRVPGGYQEALAAISRLDERGVNVGVTSQVNRLTLPTLEDLAEEIQQAGAVGWQLQLTMPSGRARLQPELVYAPEEMPKVFRAIRRLVARPGLRPYITDNLGYCTVDDPQLRTPPGCAERCWCGCFAGVRAIGIGSCGDVKGCLALPDELIEGNVRQTSLEALWQNPSLFGYNRNYESSALSGHCSRCGFSRFCRGGCTALSMAVRGRPNQGSHCLRAQGVD